MVTLTNVVYEALFASELQRSDVLTPEVVAEAIRRTVRRIGVAGCVARMAQEFGDRPEEAAARMRWARQLADEYFGSPRERHAAGPARHRCTRPITRAHHPAAVLVRHAA